MGVSECIPGNKEGTAFLITFLSPACRQGDQHAVYMEFLKLGGRGAAQRT